MGKELEKLEETLDNYLPFGKIISWTGVLGVILFVVLAIWFPEVSSYAAMICNVSISLLILWAIDKYVFKTINTVDEIKNGNIAYALFWLGIVAIICLSLQAS